MEITISHDHLFTLIRSQHRRASNKGLEFYDIWNKLIENDVLKPYGYEKGLYIDFLKKLDLNQKVKVEKELLKIELITFK